MTFADIYSEIVLRAGEGYDAYSDRAEAMFWKAVSTLIKNGEYDEKEIRGLVQGYTKEVQKSDFVLNRWSLWKMWATAEVPNVDRTTTPLFTSEIFEYRIVLEPVYPDGLRFHEVNYYELRQKDILNTLTAETGFPELIYAFDYPDIYIAAPNMDFICRVSLATKSIPVSVKEDSTTDADKYFNFGFIIRAIELATQLLKTETE